jgi:hypothetical protein
MWRIVAVTGLALAHCRSTTTANVTSNSNQIGIIGGVIQGYVVASYVSGAVSGSAPRLPTTSRAPLAAIAARPTPTPSPLSLRPSRHRQIDMAAATFRPYRAYDRPKFYFFDPGVARAAAGLHHEAMDSFWRGFAFETLLIGELRAYNHYADGTSLR